MTLRRTITNNSLFLALSTLLNLAVNLAVTRQVSHAFGPARYGNLALILALTSLLELVVRGGLSTLLTREAARLGADAADLVAPAIRIQSVTALGILLIGPASLLAITPDRALLLPALVACATSALRLMAELPIALFRGHDRLQWEFRATLLERILFLAGVLAIVEAGGGVLEVLSVGLASQAVMTLFLAAVAARPFRPRPIPAGMTRRMVAGTLPLCAYSLFYAAHIRVDTLLVQKFGTARDVGLFSAAYNLVDTLRLVPWVLVVAAFPSLSRASAVDRTALRGSFRMGMLGLAGLGLVAAGSLWLLAGPLIHVIYGRDYLPSVALLRGLAWASVPIFMNGLFFSVATAAGKQGTAARTYLFGALLHTLLGAVLIRQFGLAGAVASVLAGETLVLALGLALVGRAVRRFVPDVPAPPGQAAFAGRGSGT